MPDQTNLMGPKGRLFAEPKLSADELSFRIDNTSAQYYKSPYYAKHKSDLKAVPPPRSSPPRMQLSDVLPADLLAQIEGTKRISFHAVGDTGAAKVTATQTAGQAIAQEAAVADAMTADLAQGDAAAPAFFFHLGDVVYHFGESQYYYDQFYEPFREYDRPIFGIPGNHDGAVYGHSPNAPDITSLGGFQRNFCAPAPGPAPDAGGLVRSAMNQPGVYFTLDAPFVSIVGLYSNALEDVGVISSQGGHYPIGDDQLHFLSAELKRLAPARKAGERAVIVACHHPPVSVDSKHGGTTGLADDIDTASKEAGFWPDAVLSGHSHLYQRYMRSVDGRQIPYVVSGSGGFAITPPHGAVTAPLTQGEYTLLAEPTVEFGYLTVTVDMAKTTSTLTVRFKACGKSTATDKVTLNLANGQIVGAPTPTPSPPPAKAKALRRTKAGASRR
jgi:3',5'-cyclic AMP phosphodiesterase CpdA